MNVNRQQNYWTVLQYTYIFGLVLYFSNELLALVHSSIGSNWFTWPDQTAVLWQLSMNEACGVYSIDYNHGIKTVIKTTHLSHWLVLKSSPFFLFWSEEKKRRVTPLSPTVGTTSCLVSAPSCFFAPLPPIEQACLVKTRDSHWKWIAALPLPVLCCALLTTKQDTWVPCVTEALVF